RVEPDIPGIVEDDRVRVASPSGRHEKFNDLARLRVQSSDMLRLVAGVPDHAVIRDNAVVRTGSRIQIEADKLTRFRIEPAEIVSGLADEPDTSLRVKRGVAWPRIFPGNTPAR